MGGLLCCSRKPKKQCDIEQGSVQNEDQNYREEIVPLNQPENLGTSRIEFEKRRNLDRNSLKVLSIPQSCHQIDHQDNRIKVTRRITQQNVDNAINYQQQQQIAAQQCLRQIEEKKLRNSLKTPSISQSRNQIDRYQQNKSVVVQTPIISSKQIEHQQRERNEKLNTKKVLIIDLKFFDSGTPPSNSPVSYIPLRRNDPEFLLIYSKISRKNNFIVHKIERIENKYLRISYELKAHQKKQQFPQLKEELLFHGTSKSVVDNICTMSFDWRYVKEHKFGKGISFSTNSTYASVYSDECYDKVMLVCKVLIGNCCRGNDKMIIPSDQFDTSLKATPNGGMDKVVTVKYEDGDFYPAYKIYYHLEQPNQRRVQNRRQRRNR